MTVKMTNTGKTVNVNASYGLRLAEQGKAVAVKEKLAKKAARKDVKPDGAEGENPA